MSDRHATQDWQLLAERVFDRRTGLGMTQQDVQAAGGPAVATLRHIEGANKTNYRGTILGRLEMALGWTSGSVKRILAGGEPSILVTEQAETRLSGGASTDAAHVALSHLRARAQVENRSLGAVLVSDGLADPEELVLPEGLRDPFIDEINALDISEDAKARVIQAHLKNRERHFEEKRLKQKKLDG